MKIGIFGDSYACLFPSNRKLNNQLPWFEMLKSCGTVTTFGIGGSSLYYSYKMFLKHKDKFDKIIILGAVSSRLYVPNLVWHHVNNSIIHFPNIWKNHGYTDEEINAFSLYYKYIYQIEEEKDFRMLLEKELSNIPNCLYISIPETLVKVTQQEREFFGCTDNFNENMCAHLSNESNKTFFKSLVKWLNTGEFKFDIKEYKLPDKNDKFMYYI